jgi:hypothetical protein
VRVRSVTNAIWDLLLFDPTGHWGGFSLSGIFTAQTGMPFTVNSAVDVNDDGNLTDRLNTVQGLVFNPVPGDKSAVIGLAPGVNPLSLLAPAGQDDAFGRDTFTSRGMVDLDLAVSKTTTGFREQKLTTRFEVYNFFNHPNFGIPVRILEEPGFGK